MEWKWHSSHGITCISGAFQGLMPTLHPVRWRTTEGTCGLQSTGRRTSTASSWAPPRKKTLVESAQVWYILLTLYTVGLRCYWLIGSKWKRDPDFLCFSYGSRSTMIRFRDFSFLALLVVATAAIILEMLTVIFFFYKHLWAPGSMHTN